MSSVEENSFNTDVFNRSVKTNMRWYEKNINGVLEDAQMKGARGVDKQFRLAEKFHEAFHEKIPVHEPVPPLPVQVTPTSDMMYPVEPEIKDILMKAKDKGGTVDYLKKRYKKDPNSKFYFRECTSWDYGWFSDRTDLNRGNNFGRSQIIKATFYTTNNLGPDAKHYRPPTSDDNPKCVIAGTEC